MNHEEVVLHEYDWNLDTGGDTIEECIDNLYNLVKEHYEIPNKLDIYLEGKPFSLTEEQYNYCEDVIFGNNHVTNWSVAGSGKSLCLEVIKDVMQDECLVTAMTGIANSILFDNKGGQGTTASCLSLPLGLHNERHVKKVGAKTADLLGKSDRIKVIVVEEAGMLNPDQLDLISKRIKRYNRAYGTKRKSRKIKLVLQGDVLQLGSILSDEEKGYIKNNYGDEFLPLSKPYQALKFSNHIFSKVLRTSDKTFQEALNVLRYGMSNRYKRCLMWLNKRYQPAPSGIPVVTTTNKKVDEVNQQELAKNPNPLFELHPVIIGDYNIKNCPVDEVVRLKVGSSVISLVNDEDGNFSNGSFGYVEQVVVGEGVYVHFTAKDATYFVPMFEFEEREYFTNTNEEGENFIDQKIVGKCNHYPLKLASAFSVFRTQGRTLDTPFLVDLGWGFPVAQDNDWGKQLAYVALSRSTSIENIYLAHKLLPKHLKVNQKAVDWVLANSNI